MTNNNSINIANIIISARKCFGIAITSAFIFMIFVSQAQAALVPNLILGQPSSGTDAVQVTIYGANPNTQATLYYPSGGSYGVISLGNTNVSGYVLTSVNSSQYGITSQAPVYVMVDGQRSQIVNWPTISSISGGLSASPSQLSLTVGQNSVVVTNASSGLNISENSNSSSVQAYVNGHQIIINALTVGSSNIRICAGTMGCSTVLVTVQQGNTSSSGSNGPLSFSESSVTVNLGVPRTITVSGAGNYYISSNPAPGVVNAYLNGNALTLNPLSAGTAAISVCASSANSTSCGRVDVTVVGQSQNNQSTVNQNTNAITFNPSTINMIVGENKTANIYGLGNYSVQENPSPNIVTANINGNNLELTGRDFGGVNIKICQVAGGCGYIYVYVAPNSNSSGSAANNTATNNQNVSPSITNISISSNGSGQFMGNGTMLNINFSTNQAVNMPTVIVGDNKRLSVSGAGSGPYVVSYTLTINEQSSLPVKIEIANQAGKRNSINFVVSTDYLSGSSQSASVAQAVPPSNQASDKITFYRNISSGMTGADVTALQKLLTKLGHYSGPVTGKFGVLTSQAVSKYQKANNLSPVGVVGPSTRALLNKQI